MSLPERPAKSAGILVSAYTNRGYQVVSLVRRGVSGPNDRLWDGKNLDDWAGEIDRSDVVINLAGRSVNCRYSAQNLADMMNSRIDSTRVIGQAIAQAKNPPKVWLQMSTATIYAHRFDATNDEVSGIIGGNELDAPSNWRHSIKIATAWEAELEKAVTPRTRKVAMRTAMLMSPQKGGTFDLLSGLTKIGLGGPDGGGRQYMS